MTNYNERLDEILYRFIPATDYSDKRETDPTDQERAKQAITSLMKELVAEAKPTVSSKEVIGTYLQNAMAQKAAEYHGRNHAINQFEQNILKVLEEV